MRITANNDSEKTTLEDNAAIYAKRDERPANERFKDLKGQEKWQFFKDYALAKVVAGIVILALVASLLYSMFKPKPETIMYVAIINNPFDKDNLENMTNDMTSILVSDTKKEEVRFDSDFYFAGNEYNSRMKFMTMIAGGNIDDAIFPASEFGNYLEAEAYTDLSAILSSHAIEKLEGYIIRDGDVMYALDVTEFIAGRLQAQLAAKYYLACISNSKHKENFEKLVEYIFPDVAE
ncbi:MAG: hypothetical protein K6E85_09955 [Lachnospiraceae bacterium]|nr:hypothetical protein [Lachnospiraceae bacterium]